MQIPKKFVVNGKTVPFTLDNLKAVWDRAQPNKPGMHGMLLGSYVIADSKGKTWDGKPVAYTSACLEGSKSKYYDRGNDSQLKIQERIMGAGSEIDEGMYIAMLFHYLATGERLMTADFMRLNVRDTDGDPLYVGSNDDVLHLDCALRVALSFDGVGASLGIS